MNQQNPLAVFTYKKMRLRIYGTPCQPRLATVDIFRILKLQKFNEKYAEVSWKFDDIFRLILRSGDPDKWKFLSWLYSEVAPAIERTANTDRMQDVSSMNPSAPEKFPAVASLLSPYEWLYPRFLDFWKYNLVSEAAKILGTTERRLLGFLRENKLFYVGRGRQYGRPFQRYIDRGYFIFGVFFLREGDGPTRIGLIPMITDEGLAYIQKLFLAEKSRCTSGTSQSKIKECHQKDVTAQPTTGGDQE